MTLLLDMYFLTNLSLRVATTSARSLTPNIFKRFMVTCPGVHLSGAA